MRASSLQTLSGVLPSVETEMMFSIQNYMRQNQTLTDFLGRQIPRKGQIRDFPLIPDSSQRLIGRSEVLHSEEKLESST